MGGSVYDLTVDIVDNARSAYRCTNYRGTYDRVCDPVCRSTMCAGIIIVGSEGANK